MSENRAELAEQTFESAEKRRHDARPKPARPANRGKELAWDIGALDAGAQAFAKWVRLAFERFGSGQHDDRQAMRKVVRQIDRGRTGDVRQGQVEEEKVEGVALDLGDRPNEIRLSDDFEGTTARAGENSADFICNVDVIFDEKDADEFFIGTDVFAMRKAIRKFSTAAHRRLLGKGPDALGHPFDRVSMRM
jgi:hypothetical protein